NGIFEIELTGRGGHASQPELCRDPVLAAAAVTLLADVGPDMVVSCEETFGPVAPIAPFDTEEEVFAKANATEYGLVAYVHSQNPKRIYRATRALQFGMVAVNRTKVTGAPIPFGGMKQSGLGREGSRRGMEEFMEIKYVCRDWG
ncbi:MAG: aldehyde dehydrogenase family protein, partial [Thioclava sp.]